jgi:hypothetical protein
MIRRCWTRQLLPGDEATVQSTLDLLHQARAALLEGEVHLGASYARRARQLAGSLACP